MVIYFKSDVFKNQKRYQWYIYVFLLNESVLTNSSGKYGGKKEWGPWTEYINPVLDVYFSIINYINIEINYKYDVISR